MFSSENTIHLPTVKCHINTTTTGAMKNAFGELLNHKRHQTHPYIHATLVDLLAIQKEIHLGIFCMMDGTTAGNGTGPRIMQPVRRDVILASEDQVAIDALAARIMGFDPLNIKYIALAHESGLGIGRTEEIEVVGDVDAASENWHFEVGRCFHQFAAWLTWFGPTRFLQNVLTRPLILYPGNFYSFYDVLHWRLKERKIHEHWLAESDWGHRFQKYADSGQGTGARFLTTETQRAQSFTEKIGLFEPPMSSLLRPVSDRATRWARSETRLDRRQHLKHLW